MKSFAIGLLLAFVLIGCVSPKHEFQQLPTAQPRFIGESNGVSLAISTNGLFNVSTNGEVHTGFTLTVSNAIAGEIYKLYVFSPILNRWIQPSSFTATNTVHRLEVFGLYDTLSYFRVGDHPTGLLGTNLSVITNCCYTNDVPPNP